MNIVFMGMPGSGKTTQAEILGQKLNLPVVITGAIYRQTALLDNDLGRKVKQVMEAGGLIDDEITFQVIDKHLGEIKDGFILDGFPRTLVQAQREMVKIDKVVYVAVSDEEATKRILSRNERADDTPEVITKRLEVYHQLTEPILEYYRKDGRLLEIDGSGTIEDVEKRIWEGMGNRD